MWQKGILLLANTPFPILARKSNTRARTWCDVCSDEKDFGHSFIHPVYDSSTQLSQPRIPLSQLVPPLPSLAGAGKESHWHTFYGISFSILCRFPFLHPPTRCRQVFRQRETNEKEHYTFLSVSNLWRGKKASAIFFLRNVDMPVNMSAERKKESSLRHGNGEGGVAGGWFWASLALSIAVSCVYLWQLKIVVAIMRARRRAFKRLAGEEQEVV